MGSVQIFCGCMNDEERLNSIIRNGKTCAMVGYNYLDYSKNNFEVWTNYECSFAEYENIGMQAMIDKIRNEDISNRKIIMSVTELGDILDSIGSNRDEVLFINAFLRQLGKFGGENGEVLFRGDLQRFNDLQKRFRIHTTDILIPGKFHLDNNTMCNSSKCKRPHKIKVYSEKPMYNDCVKIFNAVKVGAMYNTYQITKDKLKIPTKKEIAILEQNGED
jgi:hypothetical protein